MSSAKERARRFCGRFGLELPILLAPMAGACPPSLSVAVMNGGGMGACGALLMKPEEMRSWANDVRTETDRPFQINLWIPDPPPRRDEEHEAHVRGFLEKWGPPVPRDAGEGTPPNFEALCEEMLSIRPAAISSIMGLFPHDIVARAQKLGIAWLATATTVAEAREAEQAGADVIIAQGMEAGGHRGCFVQADAERKLIGLFALVPAIADAVKVPVIAAGGISDERGIAAALTLGAHAVAIGTGYLRCPESKIHPAWADSIGKSAPEETALTRAFSGRAGRSIATNYVLDAMSEDSPKPAPYPVQRGLTAGMRTVAQQTGDIHRMQAWAGQSAALAKALPAEQLTRDLWDRAQTLLK